MSLHQKHRDAINELYRPLRINFPRRRTEIRNLRELQLDLGEMSWLAPENDGFKYFLLCVNPFSKKFYTAKLMTKGAREVCNAVKRILNSSGIAYERIFTDKGAEFKNTIFRREIEEGMNILHFYSTGVKKVCASFAF